MRAVSSRAWYLPLPEHHSSAYVVECASMLAIMGDFAPGPHDLHGVISVYGGGKTARWFAGDLSPSYLAEKFLVRDEWSATRAADSLISWIDGYDPEDDAAEIAACRRLAQELRDGNYEEWWEFSDAAHSSEYELFDEGIPGFGYPEEALRKLVIIQRAFRAAWLADVLRGENAEACAYAGVLR